VSSGRPQAVCGGGWDIAHVLVGGAVQRASGARALASLPVLRVQIKCTGKEAARERPQKAQLPLGRLAPLEATLRSALKWRPEAGRPSN